MKKTFQLLLVFLLLIQSCFPAYQPVHGVGAAFDGGGAPLIVGKTVYFIFPIACSIPNWSMAVDTGTATVDVWKSAYASGIPTVANSITAAATPAIATGTTVDSTAVTTWTGYVAGRGVQVNVKDRFGINLKAVSGTTTYVSLVMTCQ